MALAVIPQTEAFARVDATPLPGDRPLRIDPLAYLGFGLVTPFRRDQKNDFAFAGGVDLVKSCVAQILGMRGASIENPNIQGELFWDPNRGSQLERLRHQRNTAALQDLARIYVVDAIRRYEPRIQVKQTRTQRITLNGAVDAVLKIGLVYDVSRTSGGDVVFADVQQNVQLGGT